MKIGCSSSVVGAQGRLTVQEIYTWVNQLPIEADMELVLMLGDEGTQRDPFTILRGLTAKWEEDR